MEDDDSSGAWEEQEDQEGRKSSRSLEASVEETYYEPTPLAAH
jgi:hypothetical protein